MLILSVFICSLPAPAIAAPVALGAAASFGVFGGGAGKTNQGIYSVVNVNIVTTAAIHLVTEIHDKGAAYSSTNPNSFSRVQRI
jgi:hypothetical protein